ncbi:MAG: right-handed parallel beta-helix repeat-containing protein [Terriglobales bacterium]
MKISLLLRIASVREATTGRYFRLAAVSLLLAVAQHGPASQTPPPSPIFYKTQNSDEWIEHTLHVQRVYSRVLVVDGSEKPPQQVRVGTLDLNARNKDDVTPSRAYRVFAAYKTLQAAADGSQGGDLIAVMPGNYAGFVLEDKPSAADGRYIHFKAMGEPGDVVINQPSRVADWMILLRATHHIIVQGFNIAGSNSPDTEPHGPRAGIMMDGDFSQTSLQTHHIILIDNFSHHHRKWGFHSRDTHTVLIQNNLFAFSKQEHSGYASDGSDNYVIRRNVFFGSNASGLQCNLDSVSSLHDLVKNAQLKGYPKEQATREWAVGLVRLATEKFGANNFPDGKGVNFIIEDNVINQNGKAGGGSLNLAGLQDSLIQNNLIYGNFNHGIAQWDDANPYDSAYVDPGPSSPDQVKGPNDLPLWGCQRNLIRSNTVLMNNPERAAMQCRNGSWGTKMRNNIFINDQSSSIEVYNSSIYRLDSAFDVINALHYVDLPETLKSLATRLPEDAQTITGITQEKAGKELVRYGSEPWVILDGKWWRLNPNRPDFRPRPVSKLFTHWGDRTELPRRDLAGRPRKDASLGALAPLLAAGIQE